MTEFLDRQAVQPVRLAIAARIEVRQHGAGEVGDEDFADLLRRRSEMVQVHDRVVAHRERAEISRQDELINKELDGLIADTNQTIGKMRQLAQDIRPTMLDTLGLKTTLQNHCREYSIRTGLPITLEIDEKLPELSDIYSITLYRLLQETLTNVIKHSKANHIWVDLTMDEQEIILTVQDNGQGFIMDETTTAKGIGLTGLHERLLLVGGNLLVTSAHGKGTIISAHLPIEMHVKEQT